MNNEDFWDKYLESVKIKIFKLVERKKQNNEKFLLCDLHIHSNHSSDGTQSLEEIICETQKLGFEIIALTDHDSVSIFNDLYNLIKQNKLPEFPIIIPGIEQTVSFKEYQTMCHILKYFINPKSAEILGDIDKLNKSYFTRAQIQFERIEESPVLNEIFNEYNISVSYEEFANWLNENSILPDYAPLVEFLAQKFEQKNVPTSKIYELVKKFNDLDECEERKHLRDLRFEYLDKKYEGVNVQNNRRFLLSILGVRGVDDAQFKGYKSSGSLSVDEYGQVSIYDLNKEGLTVFAHPDHLKLSLIEKIKNCAGGFVALELNFKSQQEFFNEIREEAKKENLALTVGSDKHKQDEPVYENLEFYKIPVNNFEKFIKKLKK